MSGDSLQSATPFAIGCWLFHTREEVTFYVLSARGWPRRERENDMKAKQLRSRDELRPEYKFDYSKAVRGKYYKRLLKEGANVVILEGDVARAFRGSAAVNDALRSLLEFTRSTQRLTTRSSGRSAKR
jgi:hypothetical protein